MKKRFSWTFAAAFAVTLAVLVSGCGGPLGPGLNTDVEDDGSGSNVPMVSFEVGTGAVPLTQTYTIRDDPSVVMVRIFGRHLTSHAVYGPYDLTHSSPGGAWTGSASDLAAGTYLFYVWAYNSAGTNPGVLYYGVTGSEVTIAASGTTPVTIYTSTVAGASIVPKSIGPAGGWIFYKAGSPEGWGRYLEAWTADESGTYQWKTSETETSGTSTAIGTGSANTTAMVETLHPAADVCRIASHNLYEGWFLPSQGELQQIWWNLVSDQDPLKNGGRGAPYAGSVGGFAWASYWCSSEYTSSYGYLQYFGSGDQSYDGKMTSKRVRAVRAF